jgi:hypothetical protein
VPIFLRKIWPQCTPCRLPDRQERIVLQVYDHPAMSFHRLKSGFEIFVHQVAQLLRGHFFRQFSEISRSSLRVTTSSPHSRLAPTSGASAGPLSVLLDLKFSFDPLSCPARTEASFSSVLVKMVPTVVAFRRSIRPQASKSSSGAEIDSQRWGLSSVKFDFHQLQFVAYPLYGPRRSRQTYSRRVP